MRYLMVKNWETFQHYKDRDPPWIKLHRSLLADYEFSRLQDASKAHLMLIWLFAGQFGGRIPDDPEFLRDKLSLKKPPDLKALIAQGLLIPEQDASKTLQTEASNTLALARSREERRGEDINKGEESKPLAPRDDSRSAINGNAVAYIPLNDGSEFGILLANVEEFEKAYPAVDCRQTLQEIRAWCVANPTKRKTKNGAMRFVNSWLSREQNKAR